MEPTVSIIIPVYNAERFLRECLNSVLAQSYNDYEVIMINDGSKDSSYEIMQEYRDNDSRFVCYSQENQGAGAARNTGIDTANGKYLTFLDADDMLAENTLSDLIPYMQSHDIDVLQLNCTDLPFTKGFPKDSIVERDDFLSLYTEYMTQLTYVFMIFASYIIKDNNIRFKTRFCEDILFNMQVAVYCNRFYSTSKKYYIYRKSNPNSLTEVFYSDYSLNMERNKAVVEMCKLSINQFSSILSPDQLKVLQHSITRHSLMRFIPYQLNLFKGLFRNQLISGNQKLAFWGAGRRGKRYIELMMGERFPNTILIDNDTRLHGSTILGYPIVSPMDMLKPQYSGYAHIISSIYVLEFLSQIKELGLVNSFEELCPDISGTNEQYATQLKTIYDLHDEMVNLGICLNHHG